MKEGWLQIVFFGIALAAMAASLRFALATRLGMLAAVIGIVIGVLWLLYRGIKTIAVALWGASGILAQRIEGAYRRRTGSEESSHATRIL